MDPGVFLQLLRQFIPIPGEQRTEVPHFAVDGIDHQLVEIDAMQYQVAGAEVELAQCLANQGVDVIAPGGDVQ